MSIATYKAMVKDGKLRLLEPVALTKQTRVYVIFPQTKPPKTASQRVIPTLRLKNSADVTDFVGEVS